MPENNLELFGVLADIDAALQNELIFQSPYSGQPRGGEATEPYRDGFLSGRGAAFGIFRAIAQKHGLGWTPGWERPRPQFDIENHLLSDMMRCHGTPWRFEAECLCSNPDTSGSGQVVFHEDTIAAIAIAWHEHVLSEEAKFA